MTYGDLKKPYRDFWGSKGMFGQHIGALRDSEGLSGNQCWPTEDLRGPMLNLRGHRGTLGDLWGSKETIVGLRGPYSYFWGSKGTLGQLIGTVDGLNRAFRELVKACI